jgi:enterochelin esterase-like enzyme
MSKSQLTIWSAAAALVVVLVLAGWAWRATRWLRKEPWETAPLEKTQLEKVRLEDRPLYTIERVRFWANELQEPRFFIALVPKAAHPPEEAFILSHGWFDRPEFLLTYLHVDQVYEKLLAAGQIRPALLILPDVRFPDHFRRNRHGTPFPQYLQLVAEDVAGAASRAYGVPLVREKWSLAGFSFGGYLSLDIARRYSGRFGAVSVVSGFSEDYWKFWPEDHGAADPHGRGLQTVVMPGPVPRIFLACGTGDRMYGKMLGLHDRFVKLGIPHEWSTAPGGHTWKYWSSVLEPLFRFHMGS